MTQPALNHRSFGLRSESSTSVSSHWSPASLQTATMTIEVSKDE
jgi:hypothetical protein